VRPVLVLQNDADVPPGHLRAVLEDAPGGYEICRLYAGDVVPGFAGWLGVIVLGGAMGVYDAGTHPYLEAERAMLVAAVDAGVAVLGICLGCQLLADALGGSAFRAPQVEAGFEAFSSAGAEADPVLRELDGPQLTFHRDTWELPPGATLLLESAQYPQAFRFGSALAIQTHPEVTPERAQAWLGSDEGRVMLAEVGKDGASILAAMEKGRERSVAMARRFFEAWLAEARAGR